MDAPQENRTSKPIQKSNLFAAINKSPVKLHENKFDQIRM